MPTYKKIDGTVATSFAVNAALDGGNHFRLLNVNGTASFVEPETVTNVPVRVLDDGGDAQSAMTRGAIQAAIAAGPGAATDTVKWFKVPFAFNAAGAGNYDFTSTATFPTGSIVMGVKIMSLVSFDNGPNTIRVSCQSAGLGELADTTDSDIDGADNSLFTIDQAFEATFAATMNIHVRLSQSGTPTKGNGNVYVGYVEAPLT